jgi:hypothetical protein
LQGETIAKAEHRDARRRAVTLGRFNMVQAMIKCIQSGPIRVIDFTLNYLAV